jgi:hypothetical protein
MCTLLIISWEAVDKLHLTSYNASTNSQRRSKMLYQINNVLGKLSFSGEYTSLSKCIEEAIKQNADLRGANFYGDNLESANLKDANLYGANLYGANLEGTNLKDADLKDANLEGTNLKDANLEGANLEGANLPHFKITPEVGEFSAFKKLSNNVIVQILIPSDAERTNSLTGRKCRASKIEVVKVIQGEIPEGVKIKSTNYGNAVYAVGEVIEADKWDGDIRVECTHGIHFFMTLKEAQEWR